MESRITLTYRPLAVIASLPLLATSLFAEGAGQERAAAPVAVYMAFDGEHSARAVEAMKREAQSLIKSSGMVLHWRLLSEPRREETFADLMVVKFHGKCAMDGIQLVFSELGPDPVGAPLGSTKTVNGKVLPFSDLECDRIRHSIAPIALGYSSDEREDLLGRSLGRVLAHELFHIFADTGEHSHEGVAKTSFSRKDLLSDAFEFSPKDAKRIERR